MPKLSTKTIPLLCNLCPKHPRFSDVSHLLTHISSKSHLSNRFKLQIRSQSEPQARRQLEDFDNWYAEYGLEDLLSERLSAKEHKKIFIKHPRVSSIVPKIEHKQREQSIETSVYRPPIPRMHTWSTGADFNSTPVPHSAWNQEAMYTTPTMQRTIPNFAQSDAPLFGLTDLQCPSPAKPDGVEEESDFDTSKLKGVLWPGMDLFDSATAEMKRMRNQRKDRSVLEQMKMNSADVEPTELVFDSTGALRKARHIFDDATDSGPEEIEPAPTPRKRRVRKSLLADINTNIPRRRLNGSDTATKTAAKRKVLDTAAEEVSEKISSYHNSRKVQRSLYAPSTEEDEEFRLTMETLTKGSKFSVFRDEHNSPGRTESPLEEHRFDFSNDPTFESKSVVQHSPTQLFKPLALHFLGKENIQPEHLTHTHRMRPSANGFPPQVFHNDSFNPLLFHAQTNTFAFGDHTNYPPDAKQPTSSFNGDFKPLPMVHSFPGVGCAHGLSRYGIDDMQFGI